MRKYFFLLNLFVLFFISCDKDNTPPEPAEINPIGESVALFDQGLVFSSDAGQKEITFSSNRPWTISIIQSGDEEWCNLNILSGSAGETKLIVSVLENTNYDDRMKSIIIQAENVVKTISVKQKNKNALIISNNKFEVDQLGCAINVELKSNVDYSIIIPEEFKSWISQPITKSLTLDILNFNIARNDGNENRNGKILVKSTSLCDTVYINQKGGKFLEVTNDTFSLSNKKDTINVDIISNIEFEALIPTSATWIKPLAIKKDNSKSTISYEIDSNNTYISRNADIIYYEKDGDLVKKITIIQAQKEGIIVPVKNYDINGNGGEVAVSLSSNIDFEVIVPKEATWLSLKEIKTTESTGGLLLKKIFFTVSNHKGDNSRSVVIKLSNSSKNISESITINQSGTKDVYWGNLSLLTLQEFQDFKNSGYKKIVGNLFIKANSEITSLGIMGTSLTEVTGEIYINGEFLTDLSGFSSLKKVGYLTLNKYRGTTLYGLQNLETIENDFQLLNECRPLKSFNGMGKLKSIGGSLKLIGDIYNFHELSNFEGLNSLETIGKDFVLNAEFSYLMSFKGLNNLRSIGGEFSLRHANRTSYYSFDSLINFDGLNSLEYIGGSFKLNGSFDNIETFKGLEKLEYIGGNFENLSYSGDYSIFNKLKSFNALSNIKHLGGILFYTSNVTSGFNTLKTFEGFENILIIDNISIFANNKSFTNLESFRGLNNITEVRNEFIFVGFQNNYIDTFEGFNKITKIGGGFSISELPAFTSLKGFENLKFVNGYLKIRNCERLNNIDALTFLYKDENTDQNLSFEIMNCPRLFDFCPLKNLVQNLTGRYNVTGNGFNPTLEQIKNGECNPQK